MEKSKINFTLLWLGQLVSSLGCALYALAIDIFVLEMTGSTAVMGIMMALVTIPRIIMGPFVGVIVDRFDRKKIIVFSDVISGVVIGIVALTAQLNIINVAIIIGAEISVAICNTFLGPAVESSMVDIVAENELTKSNSRFQMATVGAEIIGSAVGGVLLASVGYICVFFVNSVSFLLSAFSENFMKIPKHKVERQERMSFREELACGMKYIWGNRGLLRLIIMSTVFNFLFGIIRVSIIPWFTNTKSLGMGKYGLLNALISGGMIVGMFIMSLFTVQKKQNYRIYIFSVLTFIVCISIGALFNCFVIIAALFFVGFIFQFVFNIIMGTSLMMQTPDENRGKVIATKTTLVMIASPIGNFAGGLLCECFSPDKVILVSAVVSLVSVVVIAVNQSVRDYLNGDDTTIV